MVRATLQDLDLIEKAVQVLNMSPPQVNIKAKFLEIGQNDNKALGFDWYLGNWMMKGNAIGMQGGTAPTYLSPLKPTVANPSGVFPGPGVAPGVPGPFAVPPSASDNQLTTGLRNSAPAMATITGILTDPQFRVVIRALEQRDGTDLLACPEVTTLSGRQTQIKVVDVRYIVTTLDVSQTSAGGGVNALGGTTGGGGVGSVLQPYAEPIELGPVLDVVPYVTADGYGIQMAIIPTVKQFLGYDKSQDFVTQVQSVGVNAAAPLVQPTPLPMFRLRQVATSAIVWDGQTVVLGGLLAEEVQKQKDKVPILGDLPMVGRLFRSESNNSQKKNLLIFVTPRIIDPAGNPMHSDEEMPFAQKSAPPQKAVN
jgi:general secretion pathway protein D